jgi:hypothetical protein
MPDFSDASDFLSKSTILRRAGVNRQFFDPDNPDHVDSLRTFINTGNWGAVQFYCEFPFTDVPMTVLMKFAGSRIGARRQTAEEVLAARSMVKP